jgi:hypothetical protein
MSNIANVTGFTTGSSGNITVTLFSPLIFSGTVSIDAAALRSGIYLPYQ